MKKLVFRSPTGNIMETEEGSDNAKWWASLNWDLVETKEEPKIAFVEAPATKEKDVGPRKVFIVMSGVDHEGTDIVSVHRTKDGAKKTIDKIVAGLKKERGDEYQCVLEEEYNWRCRDLFYFINEKKVSK